MLALAVSLGSAVPARGAPEIISVRPHETDSAIRESDKPHRIFHDDSVPARGQLLVFLPGTGATTSEQDEFGRVL